ncbi:hypothetical protein Tco_0464142 [Tanacetum coccineum]
MDDPNITMEEYILLMDDKAQGRDQTFNWETANYGENIDIKPMDSVMCTSNDITPIEFDENIETNHDTLGKIWYDKDVHDLRSVETEFTAIVFDNAFTYKVTASYEPTVSPLNDNKINFRISFDESDDEDYTVIYDENSFSYKIISVDNLKTDLENYNHNVNMPSFSSPEHEVSYSNDLDFFKDFENEFPAIVYNDALTSKSDFLIEHTISPQRIDEFNNETSLIECDEKE